MDQSVRGDAGRRARKGAREVKGVEQKIVKGAQDANEWVQEANTGAQGAQEGAQHVVGRPREGDALSQARRTSVEAQLKLLGLNLDEVLAEDAFEGTSARKALSSFINPRAAHRRDEAFVDGSRTSSRSFFKRLDAEAKRVAEQVMMHQRQHSAKLAEWILSSDAAKAERDRACKTHPLHIVLDNLRSAYNVGSIFRTAETAGAAQVITCGITPHPPHDKLAKTAFSSLKYVHTRHFPR